MKAATNRSAWPKGCPVITPERLLRLLVSRPDNEALQTALHRLRQGLPPPVIWLFGKVQAGKTSIIRGLTGAERAQIGAGFAPCTRWAARYDFPNSDFPLAVFLDTRGLGEAGYDPREDLAAFRDQAHMLLVVVKAMDMALEHLLAALEQIVRAKPSWPIVVAQTTLHEGYPPHLHEHLSPYPFASASLPETMPVDLVRALAFQRTLFARFPVRRFVPIDFTLPEDGFADSFYGREALLDALAEAHPHAAYQTLRQLPDLTRELKDLYFRQAQPYILSYALAAGAVAAAPLPVADLPVISALQLKLLHTIALLYRQPLEGKALFAVAGTLGLGMLFRQGARSLLKVIPGLGSAVSGLYAGATTYALGCALCFYYQVVFDGHLPRPEQLKAFYQEKVAEGMKVLRNVDCGMRNEKP
ncbi:MAG: GTPase family protein [Candidatus Binatia bacterium]